MLSHPGGGALIDADRVWSFDASFGGGPRAIIEGPHPVSKATSRLSSQH
jgi:hypothetical protein